MPQLQLGMRDVDWIAAAAALGLVVISRDRRMRTRPAERQAMLDHGRRWVWIGAKRDQSTWDWAVLLAKHWDRLEAMVTALGDGPWFLVLTSKGLHQIEVRHAGNP